MLDTARVRHDRLREQINAPHSDVQLADVSDHVRYAIDVLQQTTTDLGFNLGMLRSLTAVTTLMPNAALHELYTNQGLLAVATSILDIATAANTLNAAICRSARGEPVDI